MNRLMPVNYPKRNLIFLIFVLTFATISILKLISDDPNLPHIRFREKASINAHPLLLNQTVSGLASTIQNILANLPSNRWKVQVFHGNENFEFIDSNKYMRSLREAGQLELTMVDWDFHFFITEKEKKDMRAVYNELLSGKEFWNQVLSERVLIFQTDSRLCSNSERTIDDFVSYDYVGAPWLTVHALKMSVGSSPYLRVGNGGLSFRKKSAMLEVVKHKNDIRRALAKMKTPVHQAKAEDIFFSFGLWWLNNNFSNKYRYEVADMATAAQFSIEWGSREFTTMNGGDVFGVHQLPGGIENMKLSGFSNHLKVLCPDAVSVIRKCNCDSCVSFSDSSQPAI